MPPVRARRRPPWQVPCVSPRRRTARFDLKRLDVPPGPGEPRCPPRCPRGSAQRTRGHQAPRTSARRGAVLPATRGVPGGSRGTVSRPRPCRKAGHEPHTRRPRGDRDARRAPARHASGRKRGPRSQAPSERARRGCVPPRPSSSPGPLGDKEASAVAPAPGPLPGGVRSLPVAGGSTPRLRLPRLRACPRRVPKTCPRGARTRSERGHGPSAPRSPAHGGRGWGGGSPGSRLLTEAATPGAEGAGRTSPRGGEGRAGATRLSQSPGREEGSGEGRKVTGLRQGSSCGRSPGQLWPPRWGACARPLPGKSPRGGAEGPGAPQHPPPTPRLGPEV